MCLLYIFVPFQIPIYTRKSVRWSKTARGEGEYFYKLELHTHKIIAPWTLLLWLWHLQDFTTKLLFELSPELSLIWIQSRNSNPMGKLNIEPSHSRLQRIVWGSSGNLPLEHLQGKYTCTFLHGFLAALDYMNTNPQIQNSGEGAWGWWGRMWGGTCPVSWTCISKGWSTAAISSRKPCNFNSRKGCRWRSHK